MHKIEKYLVELNKKRRLKKYHKEANLIAKKALNIVETEKGKTGSSLLRQCDEYANEVLGWKGYAPWLYVYTAISGSFKTGWIPDNYFGKVVIPKVNGKYKDLSEFKSLSNEIIKSKVIPDILRVMNGRFFDNSMNELGPKEVKDYLFNSYEKVVFKLDNSTRGRGIWIFERQNFNIKKVQKLGDGVFQKFIKQHSFFEKFSPNIVITLRLTTVSNSENGISARAAYLRVGRSEDSHLKATSNIRIAVDLKTGALHDLGYLPDWSSTKEHPDTHQLFSDSYIPNFQEAIKVVKKLHKRVPYIMTVGWDVVIDDQGNTIVMEWNADHNDIKFSEALTGPCFHDLDWENLWRNKT